MVSQAAPTASGARAALSWPVRLLRGASTRESRADYDAGLQARSLPTGDEVVAVATAADIRGRGGAGFPIGRKLTTVAGAADPYRVVVANGEEGEPGSVKDRMLLRTRPHLVLDGLRLAGQAVDASALYVYVSDPATAAVVEEALADQQPGTAAISLVTVQPAYVAGEESAVVRFIDGGPALPTAKPPRVFESGVGGHPTVVSNVETLANLALAVRHGVDAYGPGTLVVTVSGDAIDPAVHEVPLGTPLRAILPADVVGVLCGGLFGGLQRPDVLDVSLDHASMRAAGTALGCGAFHVLSSDGCPVELVTDGVSYLARQSSQQCGSCFKGTEAMAAILRRLSRGEVGAADLEPLTRWSTQLRGRGNCALLDATCELVASLLAHWDDAIQRHLTDSCGVCDARRDDFTATRLAVSVESLRSHRPEEN